MTGKSLTLAVAVIAGLIEAAAATEIRSSPNVAEIRPSPNVAEIRDMGGHVVTIPERVGRVYGAFTSDVAIMAALAPDLLAGTYADHTPQLDRLLPAIMTALPRLEANAVQVMDPEKVVAAHVDLTLSMASPGLPEQLRDKMTRIGVPTVEIKGESLADYPASFRFLGQLLGRADRGEMLAAAIETRLAQVTAALADLPADQRPRLYWADSPNGLVSQCATALRAEVIGRAGGANVVMCDGPTSLASSPQVSPEQLIAADPQVILARDPRAAELFRTEPRWAGLAAVRNGRVFTVPPLPFNWFDRPPSYMRVLGVQWLASRLHPDRVRLDMAAETRTFFALFFDRMPTDGDVAALLAGTAPP